jgi:lantibiotic biosynthesis protein
VPATSLVAGTDRPNVSMEVYVRSNASRDGFRANGAGLMRATAHTRVDVPMSTGLAEATTVAAAGVSWLRQVWEIDNLAEALEHASPVLAAQVCALGAASNPDVREVRRAVLSVARYLRRMTGRATPFGLLAGVAAVTFGAPSRREQRTEDRAIACAASDWLAEVITGLETCPELLARIPVVVNSTVTVRGDRLIVPYQAHAQHRGTGAVEVSLRLTAPVRAAIKIASSPIRLTDLCAELQTEFPAAASTKVMAMLTELVARRALITGLHAPSTEPDALGHVLDQLHDADAAAIPATTAIVGTLQEIHAGLRQHNRTTASEARVGRARLSAQMRSVATTARHPLALDLRLGTTIVLPRAVAREIERAALVLTRLSAHPIGAPAWRAYHQRFYERFGIGSLVPVLDVVSDSGIGWPDGYPGTVTPEPRSPMSSRDQTLLALAQRAALDGQSEVVLDDALIDTLRLGPERLRPPSHLEVGVRVHASSQDALSLGEFRLQIINVSRAAGVLTGRFLNVLAPQDSAVLIAPLRKLPGADRDTVAAQLSFPALDPGTAHVTRTPHVLPTLISLGEYRSKDDAALTVQDLVIGCDGRRMYLAAPGMGRRVEAAGLHALNLRTHTPPLARLLTELSHAQCAQVTTFAWGAATGLPYLPRLRYGRIILSPARWRLEATELPPVSAPDQAWDEALAGWRHRRGVPDWVHLVDDDRLLPLDLNHPGHRLLLRSHLGQEPMALLTEAPRPEDSGWCDASPHEIVVAVTATTPPSWPILPMPTPARVLTRNHGQVPAVSRVLLANLYGDVHRQDVVLTQHLPALLFRLDHPAWWFIRYRDPDHHLRLRIALPEAAAFGEAAATISTWTSELRRLGLLREVRYATSYPEFGRWGAGLAWSSAERVFRADSRSVLVYLGLPARPHRQALIAAYTCAIATAFTGSAAAGMRWLIEHVSATPPAKVPRPVFQEAVHIADPRDNWAALRAVPGCAALVEEWTPLTDTVATYRSHFPGPHTDGIATDDVLRSLLHANFVRTCGIDFDDEAIALHLARSAALTWTARTNEGLG